MGVMNTPDRTMNNEQTIKLPFEEIVRIPLGDHVALEIWAPEVEVTAFYKYSPARAATYNDPPEYEDYNVTSLNVNEWVDLEGEIVDENGTRIPVASSHQSKEDNINHILSIRIGEGKKDTVAEYLKDYIEGKYEDEWNEILEHDTEYA